ncbi:asparagine synthase (glutamine-hydrolyzing) [Angustibacter sp. Root456]|uniref:asparagine synthase (glutamine-hydrolyzing) n=1 Tax=Angustibacter sp. Root456 TaxID=1736539 RepID=UPI0006FB6D02|nr:asparagine synthase (glutamine-hydrolyzing) [Angustibacter sp. Root456]KQX69342.1 asparagine synthase [Angustibacter sp. Root456]
MCGIAGVHRFDGEEVPCALVTAMADRLEHRGPDGSGSWTGPGIGFGHRRLAIIDLAGSHQPMATADGRYHLCFNGEIFNYRELRRGLDHRFVTDGDVETLLALFVERGVAGLSALRGQFAFAVHDTATRETWLVRDRLGVLPLYYAREPEQVVFGSEVKALEPALTHPLELDHQQLPAYLMRRSVPAPGTLFRGVHKVPPGCVLHLRADGQQSLHRYWELPDPSDVLDVDLDAAADLVDRALGRAVDDALVADVPVGSYLSGGVDSSLVVALASRRTSGPVQTFSATFGDPRYDESAHAREVARQFGTAHHEVPVDAADFQQAWIELTRFRDAPLSEPADIAVHHLARTAREHVKVVLSGEGSDELFGGYPKYRFARATTWAGVVPQSVRSGLLQTIADALPAQAGRLRIAARAQSGRSAEDRLATWFAPFTAAECERLLGARVPHLAAPVPHRDAIDLLGRLDLMSWLPDNLLERGDRMSMAASLELRPPFLDHRLVELAFRLPSSVRVHRGQTKAVLKQVARRYLPTSIVDRPKVGFRVPLDSWFRSGLRDIAHDLLLGADSTVAQVMDPGVVAELVRSHDSGRRNEEIRLWTLLSLEMWARAELRPTSSLEAG